MLTAMTILSGRVYRKFPKKLMDRRIAIMVQSAAYNRIRQEGISQISHEYILKTIKISLPRVPESCIALIKQIRSDEALEQVFEYAPTAPSFSSSRRRWKKSLSRGTARQPLWRITGFSG